MADFSYQRDSEQSEECIDFTMIITSRNNAPISNYGSGFRCKSEYPWCIIEFEFIRNMSKLRKFAILIYGIHFYELKFTELILYHHNKHNLRMCRVQTTYYNANINIILKRWSVNVTYILAVLVNTDCFKLDLSTEIIAYIDLQLSNIQLYKEFLRLFRELKFAAPIIEDLLLSMNIIITSSTIYVQYSNIVTKERAHLIGNTTPINLFDIHNISCFVICSLSSFEKFFFTHFLCSYTFTSAFIAHCGEGL
ncbi:hypothetical protein AGLY_006572 [Aphis glycines]|uniref:Uncharacterized protein n=1 Tax=Aphis glycines TaxID=307491 RepID=A0A6G0TSC2_APHGL|nr:hypothetical protein AGLY_006572 [Aphis glycines]